MKPSAHAGLSLALGGLMWGVTRSPGAMASAFIVGVFVDLDHLYDYWRWVVLGKADRLFFPLHAYEWLAPAIVASYLSGWDPVAISATMAFFAHILADNIANPVRPLTYFISYRALKGFRALELAEWTPQEMWESIVRLPLVGRAGERLLLRLRAWAGARGNG